MKERFLDSIERHVVYFLAGFVSVLSVILLAIFLYLFMFAPLLIVGRTYLMVVPVLIIAMYLIGRKIIDDRKE